MTVYIVSADLTRAPVGAAGFLEYVADDLDLACVCWLKDESAAYSVVFAVGDGLVLANPDVGAAMSAAATAAIQRAVDQGAVVLPIAMTHETREPPAEAADAQSFDVADGVRQRGLPGGGTLESVAHGFGRQALARLLPSMAFHDVRLFLCHRRFDGEGFAAAIDEALSALHQAVFRDLINIQVGEAAQEKIDEELATADVLVFLDTPTVGESDWVTRELATALGRGIPIVWIQVGGVHGRIPLEVRPGGAPRIVVDDATSVIGHPSKIRDIAEQILTAADELNRAHVRRARELFWRIHRQCAELGRDVQTLDARFQIFASREENPTTPYPTRPKVHILQIFARHPSEEDQLALTEWLAEHNYGPHEIDCRAFDAAVLLSPLPGPSSHFGDFGIVQPAQDYLAALASPAHASGPSHDGTLLLFGAFPTARPTHAAVIEAVHSVSGTWLDLGGRIVCGGHPTFVPLLTEAIRARGLPLDRLVVVWSRFYVSESVIKATSGQATVVPIDAVPGDRAASLTAMRRAMVALAGRAAVIAIGGRTDEHGTHTPGLDEETALAHDADLPIYLIGAPGGHAAVLAERARSTGWVTLGNGLTPDENAHIAGSDRFEEITGTIWRH